MALPVMARARSTKLSCDLWLQCIEPDQRLSFQAQGHPGGGEYLCLRQGLKPAMHPTQGILRDLLQIVQYQQFRLSSDQGLKNLGGCHLEVSGTI